MKKLLQRSGTYRIAVTVYAWIVILRIAVMGLFVGRKLLVLFRAGGLGDIVATLPSVGALRKLFPDRMIVYFTRPEFGGIASLVPTVDKVIGIHHGDAVAALGGRFFDCRSFRYGDEMPGRVSSKHFVEEMAESVSVKIDERDPEIHVIPLSNDEFKQLTGCKRPLGKLVAIHAGPTAPVREWPVEEWNKLVEALIANDEIRVLRIGIRRHFLHGEVSSQHLPGTFCCLRVPSLSETARLLKACDLFIGIDSGPLHLAAAAGVPTIGIFGPVNPSFRVGRQSVSASMEPLLSCQFCHHQAPRKHWETDCPFNIACMRNLKAEVVLKLALNRLNIKSENLARTHSQCAT